MLQNISCRVTRVPTKNFVALWMIPVSPNNRNQGRNGGGASELSKMPMLEQKLQINIDNNKITQNETNISINSGNLNNNLVSVSVIKYYANKAVLAQN